MALTFKMKYAITPRYLTAPSKRRSGIKMPRVSFVVAHDTGNPGSTASGNVGYYERSRDELMASAHLFVDDKEIIECIPLLTGTPEKAWHVMKNIGIDKQLFGASANDEAMGVELCYGGKINMVEAYKRYIWVIAYTFYKFKLDPAKAITSHKITDPARRTDPDNALKTMGKTYTQFLNDVVAEYKDCTTPEKKLEPVKEDDTLKLDHQWQWDMLAETLKDLFDKKVLNSMDWHDKAKKKALTVSELTWINTIIIGRKM